MKNSSIIIALLLLLNGCGVFDKVDIDKSKLLDESEKVVFSSVGEYDLSEYLFPKENQIHIYERLKYKDNGGDKNYNQEPLSINRNNSVEYSISEGIIVEGADTTYSIEETKIEKKELVDEFYDVRELRRYLNIGDYYFSYEFVDAKKSTLYQIGFLKCIVEEHMDKKEILGKSYSDVLLLSCQSESADGVRGEFRNTKEFTAVRYYAKNVGEIGAIGEECYTKQYNQTFKGCTKTVKKLKEIIR